MSFRKFIPLILLVPVSCLAYVAMSSSNTANTGALRDASGNFAAGTVTAALTGAASSNVLKAGDTMTGPLVMPSGIPSATVINGGTAGDGITFPTSATIGLNSAAAEVARIDAKGLMVGQSTNTGNAKLLIKNVDNGDATSISIVPSTGAASIFNITTKTGGVAYHGLLSAGTLWLSYATATNFTGFGIATPTYYWDFHVADTETNPANIVKNSGTHNYPTTVVRNTSNNAGTFAGVSFSGGSGNIHSGIYGFGDTQTAASEDSHVSLVTSVAGTRTEKFILRNKGQVTHAGTAPTAGTCGVSPGSPTGNDNVFKITSGTGGVATSCAVTLATAPTTGGTCHCVDETTPASFVSEAILSSSTVTISTYSRTTGLAAAFTASDVFSCACNFY